MPPSKKAPCPHTHKNTKKKFGFWEHLFLFLKISLFNFSKYFYENSQNYDTVDIIDSSTFNQKNYMSCLFRFCTEYQMYKNNKGKLCLYEKNNENLTLRKWSRSNVIFDNFGQNTFRKKLWFMVGFIGTHNRAHEEKKNIYQSN